MLTDDLKPSARTWSVVGRDGELAELDRLLREGGAACGVVLVGGVGFGKTTLWEAAVSAARARGERVLAARPSGGELELPFAGMINLFDELDSAELAVLARPQRRALEAALLRTESRDGSPANRSKHHAQLCPELQRPRSLPGHRDSHGQQRSHCD